MSQVYTLCPHCRSRHDWSWVEAFDKFGFGDGDGLVMTAEVAAALAAAGYTVERHGWGFHNEVITSIKQDGIEIIPHDRITFGYDDPRTYLPDSVIDVLDTAFPDGHEVMA